MIVIIWKKDKDRFYCPALISKLFLYQDAAEERKVHMQQADLSRQKNQALSDLETAASERAQYLLERANTLRMEQEDEVKKLNEVWHTL